MSVAGEAHQVIDEGPLQRLDFLVLGATGGQHLIGLALHRTRQAAEVVVLLEGEPGAIGSAVPQLPQGEGQQGQGITAGGVSHQPITQPRLQPHSHPLGRSFDHLAETIDIHRAQRDRIPRTAVQRTGMQLQQPVEIGAQRRQDQHLTVLLPEQFRQQGQERIGLLPDAIPSAFLTRQQFLELIDRNHNPGILLACRKPQAAELLAQSRRCPHRFGWHRLLQILVGTGQRRLQSFERLFLWPEGLENNPTSTIVSRQPGHHPRPQQRRLAAT